jgi:ketopantoate reductase
MYFKLLVNLNTSLFALSGLSYFEYLQDNNFREIYKKCVLEGLDVYKLNGITFSDNLLTKNLTICLDYLPEWMSKLALGHFLVFKSQGFNPSMIYDFKLARKTEVEFLQGEIVKLDESIKKDNQLEDVKREKSVDVKYNKGILSLVKMIENRMIESNKGWDGKISDQEILKYIENGEVPKVF